MSLLGELVIILNNAFAHIKVILHISALRFLIFVHMLLSNCSQRPIDAKLPFVEAHGHFILAFCLKLRRRLWLRLLISQVIYVIVLYVKGTIDIILIIIIVHILSLAF